MKVIDIRLDKLREAPWNPNVMDEGTVERLKESINRYGLVENLVVRPTGDTMHEVLSGNHRLRVLHELGFHSAPCIVVDLDDSEARLLAQALNRLQGEDDLGLKAELVREILETVPESEVLAILPETAGSLRALASLGKADLADHLRVWEQAQAAKLKHMVFQLAADQLEVVEEAMKRALADGASDESNPNKRGNALVAVCRTYLISLEVKK